MRQFTELQLMDLLQKRLTQLLGSKWEQQDSRSTSTVQEILAEVSRAMDRSAWKAYLVGGTLRDLLVGPESRLRFQPRDIDIIVEGASREQLQEALRGILVFERFTRFGGLHLSGSLASSETVSFDVWTLADTWGFHSCNITPQIEDFPKTTFLNIDSCATELIAHPGKERQIFEKGFFEGISRCVLDMNYEPNPYPYVCVVRSLLLGVQLNFTIARPLAKFILENADAGGIEPLMEAQQSHYGRARCDGKELEQWLHDIRQQFSSGQHEIRIEAPQARRLDLWRDYPKDVTRD